MIELKNISKTYHIGGNSVYALQDVSFNIESGEFVAVMGASGSGKSTLMHVLGLLDTPDSGEYILSGKNVTGFTDDDLAATRNLLMGFVFQQFHLLSRKGALDNVRLPYLYGGNNDTDTAKRAFQCLKSVGLDARASHTPGELSGGEQQRVAIARALVKDPVIILADEPTGNLDSKSEREIMGILKSLNNQGKTIMMVTHELEVAEYADRIVTMKDGRIVSDETITEKKPNGFEERDVESVLSHRRAVWKKDEYAGHFLQAFDAVLSNKVRSLLSVLGILVGVASVIAMMALGHGARISMEEQLKSLGSNLLVIHGGPSRVRGAVRGADTVKRFTVRDAEAMSNLKKYVRRASGMVTGRAQLVYQNRNWRTRVECVGYDYGEMRATIPEIGRWFTQEEIKKREKVAVIGLTVLKELFANKNPLGQTIKIDRINFRVIGIAPGKGQTGHTDKDDTVYIPLTTGMYRVLGKEYLDQIYVEVHDLALMDNAKTEIRQVIKKRHRLFKKEDSFRIRDMTEIKNMISTTTRTMSLLLGCIAAISLVVGGIGIMNIMLVSVTERTREIGLRKAIGARKKDIMMQFLIESVVMTLIGGILGIAAGASVALLLSYFAGWATRVSVSSVAIATLFSVMVGIFFGLWPARRAAIFKPVDALRYE